MHTCPRCLTELDNNHVDGVMTCSCCTHQFRVYPAKPSVEHITTSPSLGIPKPKPPGKRHFHYCLDGETVLGPVLADDLLMMVVEGKLPFAAQVCEQGTENWMQLEKVPETAYSTEGQLTLINYVNTINQAPLVAAQKGAQAGCAVLGFVIIIVLALLLGTGLMSAFLH